MNKISILFRAAELATRFIPAPKPPRTDFTPLYEALPKVTELKFPSTEMSPKLETPIEEIEIREGADTTSHLASKMGEVATSCISCARSHLSTVSGSLGESLRFARDEGIAHPEVQRRLMLAEDEINILERIDLAPDAIAQSPPEEQRLAREFLPKIRELRQDIGQISSVEGLEKIAANASVLGQEFRLRHLQMKGVDLNPVLALARRVQAGEIDMATAKEELKHLLPEEDAV